MIKLYSVFFMLLPFLSFAQDDAYGPDTGTGKGKSAAAEWRALVKDAKENGYKTPIEGWRIYIGDTLQLGKGSLPNKRFGFIYQSPLGFTTETSMDMDNKKWLNSMNAGKTARVKDIRPYGNRKMGYTMMAVVGVGDMVNYWIEIDNAVDAEEILSPAKFRKVSKTTTTVSPVSVADELKKLKDLMDAGVITKEEFDAEKKKILNR